VGFIKIRKGNTKGTWWAQVESAGRENVFSSPGAFKTHTNPWGGQTQEIPNNE
jgi:hypothetical protein